jgi:hypothetical protein
VGHDIVSPPFLFLGCGFELSFIELLWIEQTKGKLTVGQTE